MAGILVRVFESFADAQHARSALLCAGFSKDSISLISKADEGGALEDDFKLPSKFTGGLTTKEEERYRLGSDPVTRGTFLMAVEADTDSRFSQAADIIDRFHPIDVRGA